MNKSLRLAALTVLALVLTCMCLARPVHTHQGRIPRTGCVLGCGNYCRAFGLATYKTCNSCYCYPPTPVVACGGCTGSSGCTGYTGCNGEGGNGCMGCGGWGGCGGGGCGGGGCGGGGC